MLKCKLCGSNTKLFANYDFNKNCLDVPMPKSRKIKYSQCFNCHFIFTPELDDIDFKKEIYNDDYIRFDPEFAEIRATNNAKMLMQLLAKDLKVIDYGGGSGKLAEILNDNGYDCTSYDPFYNNIRPDKTFDILVSFEVLEHVPNPLKTIKDMKSFSDFGLISTLAYTGPNDNWYIAPRNGHISIYTPKTLKYLGLSSLSSVLHTYGSVDA